MTPLRFDPSLTGPEPTKGLQKRQGASKDFEALLITQMLQSAREQGSNWLGGGDDEASATAFGIGEQHLAATIASEGGLGLGRMIDRSLARETASSGAPDGDHSHPDGRRRAGTGPPSPAGSR